MQDPKTGLDAFPAVSSAGSNITVGTSVTIPIFPSTTFTREADGSYPHGYSYSRTGNPNRDALEYALARLEGGAEAIAFASGTAAMMAVMQTLSTGDHVLIANDLYYGARMMLKHIFPRWGLEVSFADLTDAGAAAASMRANTKLIWAETPSNPCLKITDLAAISTLAKRHGAYLVCDNTIGTPILQRPFDFGCDLVMHSTTKYINGHSDLLGGVVIARVNGELSERLRQIQIHGGAVPSAFDAWLTQRGMHTLELRVLAQSASALQIAQFLAEEKAAASRRTGGLKINRVHYPGLPDHPQHALAQRQMPRGSGGLLAFEVEGSQAQALALAAACRVFRRATSLGGVESLIEQRASMEGPDTATPPNLLRLSIGLEPAPQLIADLQEALARAAT